MLKNRFLVFENTGIGTSGKGLVELGAFTKITGLSVKPKGGNNSTVEYKTGCRDESTGSTTEKIPSYYEYTNVVLEIPAGEEGAIDGETFDYKYWFEWFKSTLEGIDDKREIIIYIMNRHETVEGVLSVIESYLDTSKPEPVPLNSRLYRLVDAQIVEFEGDDLDSMANDFYKYRFTLSIHHFDLI